MTIAHDSKTDRKATLRLARICVTTALAAGLLSGCAAAGPTHAKFASGAETALGKGSLEKAIALAEQAVLADPRNASYRTLLGSAYLRAGRFEAARQAFDEAMQLGEDSGKAALSLALADVALGRGNEAVDTLNTYRDSIPAADYGLAMAMAGQTQTGIATLTEALRAGENTPKVRQNLAYAYALDGSWSEAKLMAQQDVPADKLAERLQTWAFMARPEDTRRRVATLLGAPATAEGGQPTALALANFPAPQQLAEEAVAMAATDKAANGDGADLAKAAAAALPAPPADAVAPTVSDASSAPIEAKIAAIDVAPSAAAPAPVQPVVSQPVVQPVRGARTLRAAAPAVAPAHGSHVVQLGSFSSAEGAQRAWKHFSTRNRSLAGYHSQTTQVTVNGRQFWRVQAVGFNGFASARQMCQSVKAKGGVCLVMADPAMVTPQGRPATTRMAQR
ncbi:MAG: SPOR domain-containing protein [Sphingomonadales bacterium]|uniref:SPOR domain-containing protein n=1 Tax=Novosphingobium sp. NDB2Meth1 TaxID=1892847 RepID=UPI0009314A0A|nr:SPOR domain-containing protein [Novosphingobium sp. NDB2Meth1]MBU6393917.1 SPOR domain-containing protein [Sphingomonadales bacterium]